MLWLWICVEENIMVKSLLWGKAAQLTDDEKEGDRVGERVQKE